MKIFIRRFSLEGFTLYERKDRRSTSRVKFHLEKFTRDKKKYFESISTREFRISNVLPNCDNPYL